MSVCYKPKNRSGELTALKAEIGQMRQEQASMQKKMDAALAYIVHLIKTRCPNPIDADQTRTTTEGAVVRPVATTTSGSMAVTDDSNIFLGGVDTIRIPSAVYHSMLAQAKQDKDPAKKKTCTATLVLWSGIK